MHNPVPESDLPLLATIKIRAGKLWTQIEAAFKQMDTAGTKLECFQALQNQEQLAARHRISNLWEEVQKQKDLERDLQKRYGDLLPELERFQHLIDEHRQRAEREKESATTSHDSALAMADATTELSASPDLEITVNVVTVNGSYRWWD